MVYEKLKLIGHWTEAVNTVRAVFEFIFVLGTHVVTISFESYYSRHQHPTITHYPPAFGMAAWLLIGLLYSTLFGGMRFIRPWHLLTGEHDLW